MNKIQKNEAILLQELNEQKVIDIKEAMRLLDVSESTVRRLFANLEQKGVCIRGHGCIRILSNDFTSAYVYESVEYTGVAEKEIIANKALNLVESGELIFLDAGTTLAKLCAKIADAIREGTIHNLTIFTNSLVNLNILKDYTKVNVIGGEYRNNRKDFCGIVTEMAIKNLCFNKCFIGTDGYNKDVGFTASDFKTASVSQALVASSEKCYILADAVKFSKNSGVCFAKNEEITGVITNDSEKLQNLAESGINII